MNDEYLTKSESENTDAGYRMAYNYYVEKLNEINSKIDEFLRKDVSKDEHKKQTKRFIDSLDVIESIIMKKDWDTHYRTDFRPLIYKLYKKLNYCAPN